MGDLIELVVVLGVVAFYGSLIVMAMCGVALVFCLAGLLFIVGQLVRLRSARHGDAMVVVADDMIGWCGCVIRRLFGGRGPR